jgi:hypothetical protein
VDFDMSRVAPSLYGANSAAGAPEASAGDMRRRGVELGLERFAGAGGASAALSCAKRIFGPGRNSGAHAPCRGDAPGSSCRDRAGAGAVRTVPGFATGSAAVALAPCGDAPWRTWASVAGRAPSGRWMIRSTDA